MYELVHPFFRMVPSKGNHDYKELRTLSGISNYGLLVASWRNVSWCCMHSRFLHIYRHHRLPIPFLNKACHLPHLPGRSIDGSPMHCSLSAYSLNAFQTLPLCQFVMFLWTLTVWVHFKGLHGSLRWSQWTLLSELIKRIELINCLLPLALSGW